MRVIDLLGESDVPGWRAPLAVRLWRRAEVAESGCWNWLGAKQNGYGVVRSGGRTGRYVRAHRVAYELLRGPIPNDLCIDHLCNNTRCVNPAHLQPVTLQENGRRGAIYALNGGRKAKHPRASAIRITACPKGHERTPENTRINKDGGAVCRACDVIRWHIRKNTRGNI